MYKKIKFNNLIIAVLAIGIAIFLVTIILGRANNASIIVVKGNKISTSVPLSQQESQLALVRVSQSELNQFHGSVVSNPQQLSGESLIVPLSPGSPIPLSDLTNKPSGGALSATLPIDHTLFFISSSDVNSMPPGIQAGDTIDVELLTNAIGQGGSYRIGVILKDVPIYSIDSNGAYLEVSNYNFLKLMEAQKLGTLIYFLPGKKQIQPCSVQQSNNASNVNCYTPQDRQTVVTANDILTQLQGGSVKNGG